MGLNDLFIVLITLKLYSSGLILTNSQPSCFSMPLQESQACSHKSKDQFCNLKCCTEFPCFTLEIQLLQSLLLFVSRYLLHHVD